MNWTDEQKKEIQEIASKHLGNALECFETANILEEYVRLKHSCWFLKDSLMSLLQCYLTIFGIESVTEEKLLIEEFTKINLKEGLISDKLSDIPGRILKLNAESLTDKFEIRLYETLFQRYANFLHQLHHRYKQILSNELATAENHLEFAKLKKKKRWRLFLLSLLSILFLLGFYWYYKSLDLSNSQVFSVQPRMFWEQLDTPDTTEACFIKT